MSSPDDNGFTPGDTLTRVEPPKRSRALTKSTLALVAAVGLAVVAAGGTYAYLNSVAPVVDAVSVSSGTASLTVDATLTGLSTVLYPGETAYGTAAVENTGSVPLAITAAGSQVGGTLGVTLAIAVVASASECNSSFTPTWSGSLAAAGAVSLGALGINDPKVLCVAVTLPSDSPSTSQSQALSFAFAINGKQPN